MKYTRSWSSSSQAYCNVTQLVGLRKIHGFCSAQGSYEKDWVIPVPRNDAINACRKCGGKVKYSVDLGAGLWRVNFAFLPHYLQKNVA
jgi:hypothetical protein